MTNRIKKVYTPYHTKFLTIFDYPIYYGRMKKVLQIQNGNDVSMNDMYGILNIVEYPMRNSTHDSKYFTQTLSGNFLDTHSEEYVRHTVGSTIDYSNTDRPQVRNATTVV